MTMIKNTSARAVIGFPGCDTVLHPGESGDIPVWNKVKDRPNYRWYVDNDFLVEESTEGGKGGKGGRGGRGNQANTANDNQTNTNSGDPGPEVPAQ